MPDGCVLERREVVLSCAAGCAWLRLRWVSALGICDPSVFIPDGTKIVAACVDGTAMIWDVATG